MVGSIAVVVGLTLSLVIVLRLSGADVLAGESASDSAGQADTSANSPEAIQPLSGPWVVAVQPGHWQVSELPDELYRLRTSTGAQYGSVREVDLNKAVVDALIPMIRAEGWDPILVPATVPPGLRADAFVAVHADWGARPERTGWKIAPAWRASQASRKLAAALSSAFGAEPNLVEDVDGVTVNMRGYFAFNSRRFEHAASPFTPSALIEMGFITNAADRELMTTRPDFYASIILRGLKTYFASRNRSEVTDLRPLTLPWVSAGTDGAAVRVAPSAESRMLWRIDPGTTMMPVDISGEWYEVFVRRHWATGWIRIAETVPASDPRWTMPGEMRRPNVPSAASDGAPR